MFSPSLFSLKTASWPSAVLSPVYKTFSWTIPVSPRRVHPSARRSPLLVHRHNVVGSLIGWRTYRHTLSYSTSIPQHRRAPRPLWALTTGGVVEIYALMLLKNPQTMPSKPKTVIIDASIFWGCSKIPITATLHYYNEFDTMFNSKGLFHVLAKVCSALIICLLSLLNLNMLIRLWKRARKLMPLILTLHLKKNMFSWEMLSMWVLIFHINVHTKCCCLALTIAWCFTVHYHWPQLPCNCSCLWCCQLCWPLNLHIFHEPHSIYDGYARWCLSFENLHPHQIKMAKWMCQGDAKDTPCRDFDRHTDQHAKSGRFKRQR